MRNLKEATVETRELTVVEVEEAAARIEDRLKAVFAVEARRMARLLATKANRELFGETEFALREAVHRIAAGGLETALEERKKGGIKVRASSARSVKRTRGS